MAKSSKQNEKRVVAVGRWVNDSDSKMCVLHLVSNEGDTNPAFTVLFEISKTEELEDLVFVHVAAVQDRKWFLYK